MDRDRGIEFDETCESGDWFYRLFLTGVVAAGTAILIHVLRLLTETVRTARREQLIGGTAEMLATILIVVGGVIATTVLLRGMVLLLTTFVSGRMKLRRYRSKRRKAYRSIDRKQALVEERIRLAARLRATWLFECESHRLANAQARREFRESLQTSVTRSCEIAFEQIAQVVDQYERVVEDDW